MIKSNRLLHYIKCLFFIITCYSPFAYALEMTLPAEKDSIIGQVQTITVAPGETLHQIARRYNVGFYEMVEANYPIELRDGKLGAGTELLIPTRYILPPGPREGIVINLAEMRLYYYPKGTNKVVTYPVGIGRLGWITPVGATRVIAKTKDPTWRVPKSIREDSIKRGQELPTVVPPGPDNPLGKHALRLALPSYLIHGTNRPSGVGMRSSSGCIRMFPENIETLFETVPIETPVRIINLAYKIGWQDDTLFLEAHQPLQEDAELHGGQHSLTPMIREIIANERGGNTQVDWLLAERTGLAEKGIPVAIGGLGFIPGN